MTAAVTNWLEVLDRISAVDRLTAIIESRMSRDLAWLQDDGRTVIRLNPEEAAWHLFHLYMTGDVVSGLAPLDEELAQSAELRAADAAKAAR